MVDETMVTGYPNSVKSIVSQSDANSLAKALVQSEGQDIADANADCAVVGFASAYFESYQCLTCYNPVQVLITTDDLLSTGTITESEITAETSNDANALAATVLASKGLDWMEKNKSHNEKCSAVPSTEIWTSWTSCDCSGCNTVRSRQQTNPCAAGGIRTETQVCASNVESCGSWQYDGEQCFGCSLYYMEKNSCTLATRQGALIGNNHGDCGVSSGSCGDGGYMCEGYNRYRASINSCSGEQIPCELVQTNSVQCGYCAGCSFDSIVPTIATTNAGKYPNNLHPGDTFRLIATGVFMQVNAGWVGGSAYSYPIQESYYGGSERYTQEIGFTVSSKPCTYGSSCQLMITFCAVCCNNCVESKYVYVTVYNS